MTPEDIKIGNTEVNLDVVFGGDPFTSARLNADLLAELFPEGKPTGPIEDEKEEGAFAAIIPHEAQRQPEETPLRCVITSDEIKLEYAFGAQTIKQLERIINNPTQLASRLAQRLCDIYSLKKSPIIFSSVWTAISHSVPCTSWIQRQSQLKMTDLRIEKFAPKGANLEWRTIHLRFALHTSPPGIESLPEDMRNRLRQISTFRVHVQSIEDWENDRGTVAATIRGIEPMAYVELLRAITASR